MTAAIGGFSRTAALLLCALLCACYSYPGQGSGGDSDAADDDSDADDDDSTASVAPPVVALQCLSEMSTVTVAMAQPETVQLQVMASFDDGSSGAIDEVDWHVLDDFGGSITGAGLYTTPGGHGGLVTLEAVHEPSGLVAHCLLEVHLEATDNVTQDPGLEFPLHGVSTNVADNCAPQLSYPLDGAVLPRDLTPPQFMWTVPGATNTSVMVLSTSYVTLTVVTHGTSWSPDAGQWFALSEPNSGDELSVRLVTGTWDNGLAAFSDTPCEASSQVVLGISEFGAMGTVYYWNPETSGLWSVGIGSSTAQPWFGEDNFSWCVGCHSANLSNPGLMALNYGGGNGWAGVVSVGEPLSPLMGPETRRGNFFALNPEGTRLIRSYYGVLYLDDIENNTEIGVLPTSGYSTHPDWSPDGSRIVYSSCASHSQDWNVWNCAIRQLDVLSDGSFAADSVLVPADADWNYYYPSYSPDSSWVSFNRHAGNGSNNHSYNNNNAEVMLVPAWGGSTMALSRASMPSQANSWPRWGPSQGNYAWLAFSSRRPYGDLTNGNTQVWISAIDLNLAVQGLDPSFPPLWLPGQEVDGSNHTPVWVPRSAAR